MEFIEKLRVVIASYKFSVVGTKTASFGVTQFIENDTMESISNALSVLDFDTKYIKLGAMVVGGLLGLNLFFGLIVLIKMAFGF